MGKLTNRGRVDAYDDFDTRKLGHSIKPVEVSLSARTSSEVILQGLVFKPGLNYFCNF